MVSQATWAKIPAEHQKTMLDLWAKNIAGYRANAAAAQTEARKIMIANGVTFTDPSTDDFAAARKMLNEDLPNLIKDAKLSPEIVRLVNEDIGA